MKVFFYIAGWSSRYLWGIFKDVCRGVAILVCVCVSVCVEREGGGPKYLVYLLVLCFFHTDLSLAIASDHAFAPVGW